MNLLSRILFPAAVLAYAVGGVSGALRPDPGYTGVTVLSPVSDTVVYQSDGYRARRRSSTPTPTLSYTTP